jgi:hypothetical protein
MHLVKSTLQQVKSSLQPAERPFGWRIRQFDTISGCRSNPQRRQLESKATEAVECAWLNPRLGQVKSAVPGLIQPPARPPARPFGWRFVVN